MNKTQEQEKSIKELAEWAAGLPLSEQMFLLESILKDSDDTRKKMWYKKISHLLYPRKSGLK